MKTLHSQENIILLKKVLINKYDISVKNIFIILLLNLRISGNF